MTAATIHHGMTFYQFSLPQTKSVRLEKVFVSPNNSTAEQLAIASNTRDKVLAAMSHQLPQQIVSSIDEYLPILSALSEQVSTSGKLALRVSLDFLWTSTLLAKQTGETRYYLYHVFPEEATHIYFLYGLAHYMHARQIQGHGLEDHKKAAASDSKTAAATDYRVEVTRLMRTAAGVFSFMAKVLLPQTSDRGSSKPPDVHISTAETFADLCLAHAQEMTIEGGLVKGTSESLLAKLASGVSEKIATARSNLGRGLGQAFYGLEQGWNVFMGAKADLWAARACKLQAIACQKAAEHGKAVGYFALAVSKLSAISPPNVQVSVIDLMNEVNKELADTKHLHELAVADNQKIYFALVPKEASELPVPPAKFMITELPYTQPASVSGVTYFGAPPAAPANGGSVTPPPATATAAAAAPLPVAIAVHPQQYPSPHAQHHVMPQSLAMQPMMMAQQLSPVAVAVAAPPQQQHHAHDASAAGGGGAWTCGSCTFHNPTPKNFCEMCNGPRVKSATPAAAPVANGGGMQFKPQTATPGATPAGAMSAAASVDEVSKKMSQLQVGGSGAAAPASSSDPAHALEGEAAKNLPRLWELISAGRLLPSMYKPTLDILLSERDGTVYQALRAYTKPGDINELMDAVDGAVVDRIDRKWTALFADCSTAVAKSISQAEKKDKNLTGLSSLVYGEVLFSSLARVVCKHIPVKPGMIFYDVGSGSGRGVFLAALLHDFKRCSGIEILNGLYTASTEVLKKWNSEYAPRDTKGGPGGPEITLHHSDFRTIDWSDGDVVFANSTCFDEQLMNDLARSCEKLKVGTYVVTLTKALQSTHFQVVESKQYPMSWGMATAITQKKIASGGDTAAA